MVETWKYVPGYDKKYQVSNTGKVISLQRQKHNSGEGYLMKPSIERGYERIVLTDRSGKQKHVSIHRLVALAFVPNPNNYAIINHKDENKLNNNADNLEWCTIQYNSTYGSARAKQGISRGRMVQQLTNDPTPVPIAIYYSISIAARINHLHTTAISKCCMGRLKSTGGFKWQYID